MLQTVLSRLSVLLTVITIITRYTGLNIYNLLSEIQSCRNDNSGKHCENLLYLLKGIIPLYRSIITLITISFCVISSVTIISN